MRGMMAMYRWICGVLTTLVVTVCLLTPAVAGQGLVYSVHRDGGPKSYLVGTMHSEDERVIALLSRLTPLIEQVDTVVVELVPDAVTLLAVGTATLLPGDRHLSGMIGDARFSELVRAASPLGLTAEILDRLKPWAAAVTLGMPVARSGRFLDMEIYLHALESHRQVLGLETAAEQLAVFDRMPQDLQLLLLDAMVKNAGQVPKQLEELTVVYLEGDLALIEQVARTQFDSMPSLVMQWFDEHLIDRRNARMLARLRELLIDNRLLVAVGAMHLAGDSGLVAGLQRLGYHVEPRQ